MNLDFDQAPIEYIKSEYRLNMSYLLLHFSLLFYRKDYFSSASMLSMWLDELDRGQDEQKIRERAKQHFPLSDTDRHELESELPLRKCWRSIAQDYLNIRREQAGRCESISYRELLDWFRCDALPIPHDLPLRAQIGIGRLAGSWAIEESDILGDAFFMLVSAEASKGLADQIATNIDAEKIRKIIKSKSGEITPEIRIAPTILVANCCTYARLAMSSFYSFIESFINSIGTDYIDRHQDLCRELKNSLEGMKKNGYYMSIYDKLKIFPRIISQDGDHPASAYCANQESEPWSSFRRYKEIRDASMHYRSGKQDIWRTASEWITIANDSCDACMEVARQFWHACYPDRAQPSYLKELDRELWVCEARKRIDAASIPK